MQVRSIIDPIISHKKIEDLNALKKQTHDGDWSQMLRLKWVVVVDVIPGLVAKSIGHLSDIFFHIVSLRCSLIFTDLRLATNAGMQALGFSVTLLPSAVGKTGYGLIESFRKSEFRLLIYRNCKDIEDKVRSSWESGADKAKAYDALYKIRDEMGTLGYLTPASLDELKQATEAFRYTRSIKKKTHAIRYFAAKLSPEIETKAVEVEAIELKEKTLLLGEKDESTSVDTPELERLISEKIDDFLVQVRAYPAPEFFKRSIYSLLEKPQDELRSQGFITLVTLRELKDTFDRYFTSEAKKEEFRAFQKLCLQLIKKKQGESVGSPKPDLTTLFSVIHGDFTGAQFLPANADQISVYLLKLIERVRSGERKDLQASLGGDSARLDQLEKRLKILRELEEWRETCGNDHKKFGQKVLEKLATEKTVSLPSGIVMGPVAQRAYITFNLEERDGKQWISGQVINLAPVTERGVFGDEFGRLRIHPELALKPAPVEEVKKSFFWRTFLNVAHGQRSDGSSNDLKIEDFTERLLQEWPTGTGFYHKRDKKPQYAMSSEFTSVRDVVQDVLGPECSRVFLLGLYDAVLEDYVGEEGITETNYYALKETSSHLARAATRSFAETPELAEAIQKRLAVLDRGIQTFAEGRKTSYEVSHFPCAVPLRETAADGISTSHYRPQVTEKFVMAPPEGSLENKLHYFITEGLHYGYSDRDKLCILRRGLEILPSVNDPIWETPEAEALITTVKRLKKSWLEALGRRGFSRASHIGSDDAALYLKVITLEFKIYSGQLGKKEVRDYFLARMKTVLQSESLYLLRPTHPDRAREYRECVDFILTEASSQKPADNLSLMEIKVTSLAGLRRYPHLSYLYDYLQSHTELKEKIRDEIRDRRLRQIPPNLEPVTDLDCVTNFYSDMGYSFRSSGDHAKEFQNLLKCWGEFFGHFGVRSSGERYGSVFSTFAFSYSGTHYFNEDFPSVYNSKKGYSEDFRHSDDKEACQTNLFLETYPGIEGEEAEQLLPILKRELPFKDIPKVHENQHLLHNEGFELGEDGMPFYELQSLLGITTYKDLSVDLLVKHFDRYFPRMRKPIFCTFFQALLMQNFIEEGNTHSLLEHASKNHPEQMFQLLDFLQKRRIKAKQYHWDQTTSFLFWIEGVALSYLIRYQKDHPQAETAYQNYLMQTRFLFQREENPELLLELSGRLLSLGPYFENSHKGESFRELINKVVAGISDVDERSREEVRRLDHGFVTHVGDVERTTLENRQRVVDTESFQGIYRRMPNTRFRNIMVGSESFPFSVGQRLEDDELEVYRQDGRDLIFKMGEPLPFYCLENGRIELLQKGNRTGLYLATSVYDSPMGQFFDRIAPPKDLYIWKNARNEVVRVDYKKLGISFEYERDPENARSGRWMSSTHPGYFLDPSFQSHEFEPSSHYLILRNHKGQRVVYMLDAPFTASGVSESLTGRTLFAVNKQDAQSLLVYHLDEDQEIDFSKLGHEELLYGMYLALQERNYDKAGRWLKEWEKQDPLHNEKTVQILKHFMKSQGERGFDKTPRSVAIRLKLGLSLLNDPLYSLSEKETEELKKALALDGFSYRNQQNNAFPFKLSDAQLQQLNAAVPTSFAFFLQMQLGQLLEKGGKFLQGVSLYRLPFDKIKLTKDALKEVKGIDNALRPHEAFTENFFAYYQLAKTADQADPRLEELRYLLRSCASDPSDTVQALREILQGVLDNPFAYPKAEEILVLQETFSTQHVITQLYNDARQANFMSFVIEGASIVYSLARCFVLQQYETHKEKIPLMVIQLMLTLLLLRIPSRFLGPFAELCEERYFGLFFRSLLSALLKPAIDWSSREIEKYRVPMMERIWTRETKESPFIQPTAPSEIHTPTLTFNSQLGAPIDTFLSLQDSVDPYLLPEQCDKSKELATLEEMRHAFTTEKEQTREPCIQRQREKFLQGLDEKKAELEKLHGSVKYQINQNRIGTLLGKVRAEKEKFDQTAREKASLILRIAHNYPAKLALEVKGGLLQALELDELIVAFGRKDHAKIMRSNPSLSKEELTRLEQLIGEYLVAKTAADRLEVASEKLSKAEGLHARLTETRGRFGLTNAIYRRTGWYHDPEKDQREVNALLADTMQILEAKRCFSGAQNPHLLVFEYFMKMTLRNNQVEFLERLTSCMGDPKALESILEEAHTGFGKSKVAIPLWLYLTSQSGRIAMITVPEPLLEEMRVHLKRVLGKIYDQGISPIYFDRTRANDLKYLKYINKVFTDAEATGKCVVISINSLHGIAVLKHKENYFRRVQEGLPPEYIEELDVTRKTLAEKVSNFIDEATDALYIRYSYDYSVGRKKPLASSYIEMTREMYDLLVEDEELMREIDFDFMRQVADEQQKYVDEETFERKVLPALSENVIRRFAVPPEHQAAARKSLAGGYDASCEELFKTFTPKDLRNFAQIRRQFVTYLRQSLSCRWNERYKLGEDRIAYPVRNGKLIPRSQFSALDLILNFTFQANIRTPFEMKHVEDFINGLIDDSLSKSQQEFEGCVGFRVYQKFSAMVGGLPQFADLKKEHKQRLLDAINSSPKNRLLFTEGYVLPKLEYFPRKIVSYPQLIFNRVHNQGATGTLVENVPSGFALNFDLKTIFRNLMVLWQKSKEEVHTIPKLEGRPLVNHLFHNFNGNFNVIIDIAGYLRGFSSNEEIAREVLQATAGRNPPIEAVGFIDEAGRNLILKRGATAPVLRANATIDVDRIFQVYTQKDVIGFDINLSREAKAIVTTGRNTRRDFFMQGVGRLRGLNTGMVAKFVTIEEEMDYIRESLGLSKEHKMLFENLFLYVFNLEGEKQGEEAFDVMYHEWLAKVEQLFWSKDLEMSMKDRTEIFNKLGNFYCQKVFEDATHSLRLSREELPIDEVAEGALKGLLATFEKLVAEHPELEEEYAPDKLKALVSGGFEMDRLREKSTQMRGGSDPQLSFSEVEQEDERDLELEMLQVKELARSTALYFDPEEPQGLERSYDDVTQYHRVERFHPNSKKYVNPNILCTDNFFRIGEHMPDLYRVTMKPARYSLVVQNRKDKTYQIVLLDLHDAKEIYAEMKRDSHPRQQDFDYYLIGNDTMNLLAENGKEKWTRETADEPKLKELMLEARPYTGKLLFDLQDQKRIEDQEMAEPFFKTIEDRFVKPWPYYQRSLDNYYTLVL